MNGNTIKFSVSPKGVITRARPKGEGTFDYAPVLLPIKEGAEWEWTYHYVTRSKGDLASHTRKCRMGGLEEVKVPAGTFSARKIECKGGYQAGSWSGSSVTTSWWAPSISAVVKIVDTDYYQGGRDVTTSTLDAIKSE